MSDVKEKYQQQILFEEISNENTKDNLSEYEQQVIIDNDELKEVEFVENINEKEPVNKPRWLWRIASFIFITLITIETFEFFVQGFSQEPLIASLYGALLLILTLIAGGSFAREYRGLKQFKRRQKLQQSVQNSLKTESDKNAKKLCLSIAKQLPSDSLSIKEMPWDEGAHNELSDPELLRLFSRQVLTPVDKKALNKISKFSSESVVLVALSPIALLDMVVMLWRNLKMVDEIANLYGLKLSYWSRLKLIKQVFINMVYTGAAELIADVGTDLIGADLLGKLSARLAQGLGAGMLTARLGLKAIHLCRPIPFEKDSPKLKDVRKQLISQIQSLTTKTQSE